PTTVAISPAMATLTGGLLVVDPLGPRAFKVSGLRPARTRFDLARARGLSPFVGRAADIAILDEALARADAGDGQVIGVVAEAGVGKSRLCFEFLEHCRARGVRVIEGRAAANGRNVPFLAILEVFRSFFDIRPEDDDAAARGKIAATMTELDANLGDAVALVADFLGVPDPDNPPPRMDPDTRQRQLFGLMRHLIRRTGERQLMVTMVEDLHWLDSASAQFIEHMVEARSGARGLLLLNYRPEYRADWMKNPWCHQIALTPLAGDAEGELLGDLLGPQANQPSLAAMIEARTVGNPFFVEEVVRNLAETGHLEGERGAYRLVTPVDRIEVPSSVMAVIAARIDRLSPGEKQVIQTAAVIGKNFSEQLIRSVCGIGDAQVTEILDNLRRGDFITELSVFPVVEYAFRHPLTQETALGSLLKDRRRKIHRSIAAAIEQRQDGSVDERAALLAHHWEEAGEPLKAALRHRQAAEWVSLTDPNAAVFHWGRVRSLLAGLADDPEAAALGVAACQHLLNLSWRFTSGPDEIKALFEEGLAFARATGDRATELKVSMVYGRACCSIGDLATYIDLATQIHDGARALGDTSLIVNAALYLVDARVYTASFPQAVQLAEETLATYDEPVPRTEWVMGFNPYSGLKFWRATCLTIMGRIPEGLREFDRCVDLMAQDQTPEAGVYISSWSATAYLAMGDVAKLQACADAVDKACTAMGDPPTVVAHRKLCLTYLHLASGRPLEAIATAQAALAIHRQGERQHAGMSSMLIAEALLHSGDLEAAIATARETIETCHAALRGNLEAQSLGILARALLRKDGAGAHDSACRALDQAEALIGRTGAQTLSPSLAEWRAEAAAAIGDEAGRLALLRQSAELFEKIGAPLQAGRVRQGL
ncbi:MAG TPA: AAA family ATPase, partial [Phenylobacterium sp.]|nr:AAA family ATPase [Phenylobacterium sp.]